jgi:hypothetical protein
MVPEELGFRNLNTNETRQNLTCNTPQAACDETTRKIFLVHSNVQELALEIYNLLFISSSLFPHHIEFAPIGFEQ